MSWLFLLLPLPLIWVLLTLISLWRTRYIERRWNHVLRDQERWDLS